MSDPKHAVTFNFANAGVLMIDASPISLEVMTNILSGYGFRRMYRSADLAGGLEALKRHPIDLILIDPFAFGDEAYEMIRTLRADARYADVPIIIVTAYTPMRLIKAACQCGADYVVAKPFSTGALLERILWVATAEHRTEFSDHSLVEVAAC